MDKCIRLFCVGFAYKCASQIKRGQLEIEALQQQYKFNDTIKDMFGVLLRTGFCQSNIEGDITFVAHILEQNNYINEVFYC